MANVSRVWFTSMVPAIDKESRQVLGYGACLVEFKLGVGPCGKTVTRLDVSRTLGGTSIVQYTDDGEVLEFIYLDKDAVGRVHVCLREAQR